MPKFLISTNTCDSPYEFTGTNTVFLTRDALDAFWSDMFSQMSGSDRWIVDKVTSQEVIWRGTGEDHWFTLGFKWIEVQD